MRLAITLASLAILAVFAALAAIEYLRAPCPGVAGSINSVLNCPRKASVEGV